jgi:hypothetical protein
MKDPQSPEQHDVAWFAFVFLSATKPHKILRRWVVSYETIY